MTLKLRQKIIILALLAGLLPVLVIIVGSFRVKTKFGPLLIDEIMSINKATTAQVAHDVYTLCETVNNIIDEDLKKNLSLAEKRISRNGGLSLSPDQTWTWDAYNQETKVSKTITLPQMMLGKDLIQIYRDPNYTDDSNILLRTIDEAKSFGGTCTIFQRMNEEGDMLRIATSVVNAKNERAIGTYIPHNAEVIKTVLAGNIYMGKALVLDKWVMTIYKPYYRDSKIIGMIYCGITLSSISSIEKEIASITLGKSGYVAVISANGEDKGTYVISPRGINAKGKKVQNIMEQGNDPEYLDNLMKRVTASATDEVLEERYYTIDPDTKETREKIAAIIYYKPWDWVIVAGTYLDDFQSSGAKAGNIIQDALLRFVYAGLGLFVVSLVGIFFYSGNIAKPISLVSKIALKISSGNIHAAAELTQQYFPNNDTESFKKRNDETSQLIRSFADMTANLNELVGQVKHSSVQLLSNATQVAATAKHQEGSLSELGSSTTEIAASIKQISATSTDLVDTMNKVTVVADDTAGLANDGRQGLVQMEDHIRELSTATSSISSKLALINDKTANISNVVTTINKIAEQTNLLSLNAAIEAEKAGEHGQGFSVVAREIRRLADQTANATLDIEQMVKEMQASVSTGVMEMDKFSEAMRIGVEQTIRLGGQFNAIISHVEQLTPQFQIVSEGMHSQSQGAQQINDAMVQLTESTRHTLDAVRELNSAADFMRHAVQALSQIIQKFNVSAAVVAMQQQESEE